MHFDTQDRDDIQDETQSASDRGLKVRIMTWNMHGKIPDCDLELLFGKIPGHDPRPMQNQPTGTLPRLEPDNSHPYHLVVVACQECPWGQGGQLTTTLHTAGEVGSLALGRSRPARDLLSGDHRRAGTLKKSTGHEEGSRTSEIQGLDATAPREVEDQALGKRPSPKPSLSLQIDEEEEAEPATVFSPASDPRRHPRAKAVGWSKVCEDYFCNAGSPISHDHFNDLLPSDSSMDASRDWSQTDTTSPSDPTFARLTSKFSRSSLKDTNLQHRKSRASLHSPRGISPQPSRASLRSDATSLHPDKARDLRRLPNQLGLYELVIKHRMMGCYLAVYVYRPCYALVKGASANHVKSGLLAGRMGNKGGVGISIHIANTRLLFINSHLAVRVEVSRKHADWLVLNKSYEQAFAFDQLQSAMRHGKVFKGFREAPVTFPPTYKFDIYKANLAARRLRADAPNGSASEEDPHRSHHSKRSIWSRIKHRSSHSENPPVSSNQPMNPTESDLVGKDDTGSLSELSESSSIMEEAADLLRPSASSELIQGDTSHPLKPDFVSALQTRKSIRKRENASEASPSSPSYDSSAKQRVPSWCDRVLFKSNYDPNKRRYLPHESKTSNRANLKLSHVEGDSTVRHLIQAPISWLQSKGSASTDPQPTAYEKEKVEVIAYNTLGDETARKVCAQSDHRPVIFSAIIHL
ncbi:hypothetical protein MYAM1_000249 [Malassezia yamatoensis]|uniref:Inositol polyphosphate-related phosphatase domain-containing protein n=1 Tax=Malassezia yamatoensis TaxID=253288 RepID=A0AAJ5YQV8_9BASI|nr:hypothetical protein MYAM1_000249 [Malassezia yamatoensis]